MRSGTSTFEAGEARGQASHGEDSGCFMIAVITHRAPGRQPRPRIEDLAQHMLRLASDRRPDISLEQRQELIRRRPAGTFRPLEGFCLAARRDHLTTGPSMLRADEVAPLPCKREKLHEVASQRDCQLLNMAAVEVSYVTLASASRYNSAIACNPAGRRYIERCAVPRVCLVKI